jgi:NhaP-type Na+/H+ and K+/H+ antiporter
MIILLIVAAGLCWFAVENGLPFWIGLLVLVIWTPAYVIMRTLARKEWKQFCKQMREVPIKSTDDEDEDTLETLPALTDEEKFYNKPLRELNIKDNCLIACIIRGTTVIIPDGNATIQLGDNVIAVTTHKNFDDLADILE